MGNVTIDPGERASDPAAPLPAEPHLGWIVAGSSAAAGVIHLAMAPLHAATGLAEPLGFAITGWLQLGIAAMIISGRSKKPTYAAALVLNAVSIFAWAISRTVGLPTWFGGGGQEQVAAIDLTCVILEAIAVVLSLRVLLAGEGKTVRLAPAFAAVAALAVATTVLTSPEAANHGHGDTAAAAKDPLTLAKDEVDAKRCDKDFNPPSYWKEAEQVGVDTRWGGKTPPMAAATGAVDESQPHGHGASAAPAGGTTTTTTPDPLEGRGSEALDQLISDTFKAGGGETAAAKLVTDLAKGSEDDYQAWLWWLRDAGLLGHAHSEAAASSGGDGGGHGGHVGPQVWTAMTDPAQCAKLRKELKVAQDVALKYPTVADAEKAGWHEVTPYVPGIAAHFMKFSLVDGKFELDQPEMLLYDGTLDDSNIVGLSYYVQHEGDYEPRQGFTGMNDHGHRHIGLCVGAGGVIGDSTTTEEQCAQMGGRKQNSGRSWMYHAWVVPGCESPWGVFSAATPILESGTTNDPGPGCAGSSVRDRYGMGKGSASDKAAKALVEESGAKSESDKPKSLKGD